MSSSNRLLFTDSVAALLLLVGGGDDLSAPLCDNVDARAPYDTKRVRKAGIKFITSIFEIISVSTIKSNLGSRIAIPDTPRTSIQIAVATAHRASRTSRPNNHADRVGTSSHASCLG